MLSLLRCLRRPPRPFSTFHRSMSQVSFPEDASNILLELDSSDKELSEKIVIYEEDISSPLPFGLDFLDVQVGELLPPEADSDWGVIRLDHEADARVQVIRKLGFGRHASVWLGQQYPLKEGNTTYCAIKVFSAYSTSQGGDEMKAVAKIGETIMTSQSPDQRHICRPVFNAVLLQPTNFKHMPNLERMISVMELCGPSISYMQRARTNRVFPLEIWKNVFRDILKALQYLHEECRLVHGDIKQGDILLNVDMGRDEVSEYLANEEEKQQYYEPTQAFRRDLYTRDPEDRSTVMRTIREPMSLPMISPLWQRDEFGDPEYNEHMSFKLADFGSAQEIPAPGASEIPEALTSPRRRAPELVLGLPWNEKADIWALGSTMLEILAAGPIFRGPFDEDYRDAVEDEKFWEEQQAYTPEDHLAAILAYAETEKVPSWMVEQSPHRDLFFDGGGNLRKGTVTVESVFDDEWFQLRKGFFDLEPHQLIERELFARTILMSAQTHVTRRRIQLVEGGRPEAEVQKMTNEEVLQTMDSASGVDIDMRLHDAALLIKKCFTVDPKERPSARELLALDFFKETPVEGAESQAEEMQ